MSLRTTAKLNSMGPLNLKGEQYVRWVFYRLGGEQRTKEEGRWRDIQNVG
jgi:hypothetical protein